MGRRPSANLFQVALLCLAQTGFSQAPGLQWARALNGAVSGTAYPQSIITDGAKNVYTVGSFRNTIDADPGVSAFPITSSGQDDIFVSKLDAGGNFVWALRIGGASADFANAIAVDNTGLIYITGSFTGTVDFDPGPGTFNLTGGGAFAIRLNSNGTLSWAGRIGNGAGNSIAIDLSNNLIIAGDFTGSSDFDPGPGTTTLTSAGSADIFVSKFLLDGTLVWAKQLGGTAADFSDGLDTDAANNIYTAGSFSGTADFDPSGAVNNLTSAGGSDIYVSKLDAAGAYVLAVRIGGAGSESANALAVDGAGDVLAAGNFSGIVDFDPGGSVSNLTSAGSSDIFVFKLSSAGAHTWSRNMGGTSSDVPSHLVVDAAGGIYTTGYFYGTADFDPGAPVFNLVAGTGNQEAFISKLTSAGNFDWAIRTESTAGGETEGVAVALDLADDLLIAGWFELTVDFDPGACTYILPSNGDDIFIVKLSSSSLGCFSPTITSVSPASGPVGSTVIISGFQFSQTPSNNTVYFGATRANVNAASSTQLTVTVPVGATYQPISVNVAGLTAYSQASFLVSFPGGGLINTCSFEAPVFFGNGVGGSGLAIGDLDGDGKTDVVTTDYSDGKIHVFRNTSTLGTISASSFASSIDFAVGTNPYKATIADIDGDGKLDIVIPNYGSNSISIFRNVSTPGSLTASSFSPKVDLLTAVGSSPLTVVCQDLDGDAKTDIAVSNAAHNTISIWQNIGSPGSITAGSFATRLDISGPCTGFAIADLDMDGKPDLVAGYNLGTAVGVSRNNSTPGSLTTGSFAAYVNFTVDAWPEYVVIGDLDSDNKPDIVTSSWPGNAISILKNTSTPGTITAGSFASFLSITGNGQPRGVTITDFDGDGLPDIGLSNQTSNFALYKNANTPGTISAASFLPKVIFAGTGNARDGLGADIDGDGKPEVITTNFSAQSFSIMRNIVRGGPTVSGFSPASGPVGSTVTITGTNFSSTLSENVINFNGTAGFVIGATASSLTVVVPPGAVTGSLSVTVNCNGPATSPGTFTVNPIVYNTCAYVTLNGTSDYIEVPANPTLEPSSITIEALVNFSATPTFNVIVAMPDGTPAGDAYAIWWESGQLHAGVRLGPNLAYTWTPVLGQWYHIALTYNSATNSEILFLDGAPLTAGTSLNIIYNSQPLIIGGDINFGSHDGFFNGKIDEVRIWNLPRTQVELLTNLTTTFSGNEPGLMAYYPINESGQGAGISVPNSATVTGATINGITFGTGATPVFTETCVPIITSFSPASGPVGSTVTITGTNFRTTPTANTVYFGAVRASVLTASLTELTVTVPTGATYDPISVTAVGLTALTTTPFIPTFSGGGVINSCSLGPKVDFAIGGQAEGVAFGDIDGDGKADLVVTSVVNTTVTVFRNTSISGVIDATSFASGISFTTGTAPAFVAIGDLDGDGKLDLAVTDNGSNTVSVFRNTSTGSITFAPRVILTTGVSPYRIAIGDLDADGIPDLAVTNSGSSTVSVFKNTTTSTIAFNPKVDFAAGTNPLGIAIGDMDADGYPDLVISNVTGNNASVYRNLGTPGSITTGTFAARVNFTTGTTAQDLAIGDLDGDGKLDFIVAHQGGDAVSVFRNTSTPGSITVGSFAARVDFASGLNPDGVAISDIDGDSKPDLMVVNTTSNSVSLLRNISVAGSITSSSFAPRVDFSVTGTNPNVGAIGDIDGDGKPDIVVPNYSNTTVSVFRNIVSYLLPTITDFSPSGGPVGTSVFITGTNFSSNPANNIVYFGATRATVVDATPTGLQVTVPVGATYQPISVLVNCLTAYSYKPFVVTFSGGGAVNACSFAAKVDFTTGAGPHLVAIGDVDGDGKADLAVTNNTSNTVSVFRNTSSGAGNINFATKVDFTTGSGPVAVSIIDIDADGKPDLVVANLGLGTIVSVFRNTSSGPGNISFAARVNFTTGSNPIYASVGDLDNDGKPDLAVANFSSFNVSVLRNTSSAGNISFAAKVDFPAGTQPDAVAIEDLDGDGKAELAVVINGNVSVFRNTSSGPGNINFAAKVDYATGITSRIVSIGDLDGDNKADLTVANDGSNTITVLRNASSGAGDISFSPQPNVITGSGPRLVSTGDLDGDGKPDLAVSIQNDNSVEAFRNTSTAGNISFATKVAFGLGARPFSVSIGDLDGDGKADLVGGNFNGSSISALLNTISVPGITSFSPATGTSGVAVTITGTNFDPTPANNIVSFNGTSATVSASSPTAITTSVPPGATTGPLTVMVGCNTATSASNFTVNTITITISPQPTSAQVCEGATAAFSVGAGGTTNITYQWQYSPDGIVPFIDITNAGGYSGTTTTTLSINTAGTFGAGRYRCRINGDLAVEVLSNDVGLVINPLPAAPGTSGNSGCGVGSISLSATGGVNGQYRWYTASTGGTAIAGEVNITYLTPALSTTTTYYAAINNGTCESARTPAVATVLTAPASPTVLGSIGCAPSASLTLSSSGGSPGEYRWYTVPTGGSPIPGETNSSYLTPALTATTIFYVSINNGTCESSRVPVDAQIRDCMPIIAAATSQTSVGSSASINIALLVTVISDPIDISSIKVISQPSSGAVATIVAGILEVNYDGVAFAGTDHLTIEACDLAGHCAQKDITIEVVGEITIFNAVSPNGDGKNDTFIIQYIESLPETQKNKVTIFNRWGTVVYDVADYNNSSNVFRGLSNSGDELPPGTYFYTIEFSSGAEKRTGFISLRR